MVAMTFLVWILWIAHGMVENKPPAARWRLASVESENTAILSVLFDPVFTTPDSIVLIIYTLPDIHMATEREEVIYHRDDGVVIESVDVTTDTPLVWTGTEWRVE